MILQMRPTITLNGHKLSIEELWGIASLKVSCELADVARPLIRRSRELVELITTGHSGTRWPAPQTAA